jgi:autotransporter-associated beta strand protein
MAGTVFSQVPSFPGALGFGANATGGRNGTVYHVTTLADSGPGSFRDAVSSGNRIVVFDVGGYITLSSAVSAQGNLTIAGQTAPGGGIGFKGGEISFASRSNIICRFIRIRPGSDTSSHTDDALSLYRAQNLICDHVSLEFGPWNNLDAVSDDWQNFPVTSITFQNCLNADPSKTVTGDSTAGQQFAAHTESVSSSMSWFYSVFANSHNRNPLAKINNVFINNVLYNCSAGYTTHTSTEFSHDIVNNYFISGPATGASTDFPWFQVDDNQSIYYSGNLFDSDSDGSLGGSITTPYWYQGGSGTVLSVPWSPITATIPTYDPSSAFRIAVSQVGALPRDAVDNLVVSQMKTLGNGPVGAGTGTAGPDGNLYGSQIDTGLPNNGYGVINGGIAALDSDNDGMPDFWETSVGLNPLVNDAMSIAADGYANIEHYLNWLADPHAQTATNTAVDVDLWTLTSGFTNASPVYTLDNSSNGVVTLTSGHIAHFTPDTDFYGLAAFHFRVDASDGSAYSNTVSVLVVPQSQQQIQPSNLIWVGDGASNVWGVGNGTNWFDGTNLVAFGSGDTVTFDDTGSNTPAINLVGSLAAGIVYVLAEQDYTFGGSGQISGGAALFKTGSGQLNINTTNTYSGGTTINEGIVQLGDGVNYSGSIGGSITNNDTLIFNNPGTVSVGAGISGDGVLIKNGPGTLTLSGTQTYTNLTTVNAGALQFSSSLPPGMIVDNGAVVLAPSGSTTFGYPISGSGTVSFNASGQTLTLAGTNTYSGGTTNANGTLQISNNNAIGSGLVSYTGGAVKVGPGVVVTNDFCIANGSTSDLSMDTYGNGTSTWAGNVVSLGSGASWRPGGTAGTLVFTGTANQGPHNFIIPRGTVHIASNAVVSATGTATSFCRNTTANSANVTVQDNASLTFGPFSLGGATASGGTMTLTIRDNATFTQPTNNFDLHNSTAAAAVSVLNLNGGTMTVNGFIKTRTGSTQFATNNLNGGMLKANSNNPSFLPALNGLTVVVKSGGAKIDDGGFGITIGATLNHDPTLGVVADGGLTKYGSGTLTISYNSTYTGPTFINAGTLALMNSPSTPGFPTTNIYVAAGATFDPTLSGAFTLGSGRTIWGNGAVKGAFGIGNGALLTPGSNSIGTLTFSNSLTLAANSTNIFEISKSPPGCDLAKILGALTNGGTLIVSNIGAGNLASGDSFKLFDASSYNGSFASATLPSLPAGLSWNTNNLNSGGIISVITTAQPIIAGAAISSGNLVFSGTGGVSNGTYYVLTSTNLGLPISQWAPVATNQFDGGGNFNSTNSYDPTLPQSFYLLQLP